MVHPGYFCFQSLSTLSMINVKVLTLASRWNYYTESSATNAVDLHKVRKTTCLGPQKIE